MTINGEIENEEGHGDIPLTPQVKAFSNNLILTEIAKYLDSVEDLKSFRLTTTACYSASLSAWRKKAFVCIGPHVGWGRVDMSQFMEENMVEFFDNFKLQFCSLPPDTLSNNGWQRCQEFRFWNECGSQVKKLKLQHCRFNQGGLVNLFCNLAPNLESLTIEGIQRVHSSSDLENISLKTHINLKVLHVSGHLPFSNWRFLEYFSNLVNIKLSKFTDRNLLSTLSALRREHHGSILNLKHLDLGHTEQSLHGLSEAQLQLETLSLRLAHDTQQDMLRDALAPQCGTLQSLQLFRFPLPYSTTLCSSSLQLSFSSLKELHLWGTVFSNFNFLMWTPSLKKLVVDRLCYSRMLEIYDCSTLGSDQAIQPFSGDVVSASQALLETSDFQHSHLEHFEMDYALPAESVQILGKWMPNLKVIKTILSDETLSVVCHQWRKLKDLQLLFGSDVTDQGITGVSLMSTVGKEDRLPNLTDLTGLVHFGLECFCRSSTITDVSAHDAFLVMPNLQNLKIYVSPELSQDVEALLKENISCVQIFRNYDDEHSRIPLECCGRAAFNFNNQRKWRREE